VTTRHPKMDVTNGHSTEHFRRMGLSETICDAAVPRENCMDVLWLTDLTGHELARFYYPNVYETREKIRRMNDGTQPLEPYMRMSQIVLKPMLAGELAKCPLVELRFGWAFGDLRDEGGRVVAAIREVATGKLEGVTCELLAGCDGGSSRVRECLGIDQGGVFKVANVYMVHFRSIAHDVLPHFGTAWHYQSPTGGTLIAQDDDQFWTLHKVLGPDEVPGEVDPVNLAHDFEGKEFPFEILQANHWMPHPCVADSYGRARVWLAADSTHQVIPAEGYGMNTGISDAMNLSWKFAAFVQGWGGQKLLESINDERRPIAVRNRQRAMTNMQVQLDIIAANSPDLYHEDAVGEAERTTMSKMILELGNIENESLGIEVDDRYVSSPVVWQDIVEPPREMDKYTPSTCPGMRAPHVFLESGEAIFDLMGTDFTLVRFTDADVGPLMEAAEARGIDIRLLDIRDANAHAIYLRDLVLVRPDLHVCWRGNRLDQDPGRLIDRVCGVSRPPRPPVPGTGGLLPMTTIG